MSLFPQQQQPYYPQQQPQPQQQPHYPQQQQPMMPAQAPLQPAYPQQPQQGQPFAPVQQQAQRQAPDPRAVFANIGSASASKSSNWIRPIDGLFEVLGCKLVSNVKQEAVLIIETRCLHIISDEFARAVGAPAHIPGEEVGISFNSKHLSFLGNVKELIADIEGVSAEQIDQLLAAEGSSVLDLCVKMTSQEQPYAGLILHISARQILTKRNTPFTKVKVHREVRPSELPQIMPPEAIARFFPGDKLQQRIAAEQAIHGGSPQPAPQAPPQQQPAPQAWGQPQQQPQPAPQAWGQQPR